MAATLLTSEVLSQHSCTDSAHGLRLLPPTIQKSEVFSNAQRQRHADGNPRDWKRKWKRGPGKGCLKFQAFSYSITCNANVFGWLTKNESFIHFEWSTDWRLYIPPYFTETSNPVESVKLDSCIAIMRGRVYCTISGPIVTPLSARERKCAPLHQ